MLKKIFDGIMAGILISCGGSVFLACSGDNKYVGAVMFSVALLCICAKGYSLFTGKICYIPENHSKEAFSVLLWGLLGNVIGTLLCGLAVAYAIPNIGDTAVTVCAGKLAAQNFAQTFIRAIFCGIMVYLSVAIYREKNSFAGIVFCIPTFILSGFEHSIADMFYFAAAKSFNVETLVFIIAVLLGNVVGGMLLPLLTLGKKEEKK